MPRHRRGRKAPITVQTKGPWTAWIAPIITLFFLFGCAGLGKRLEPPRIHIAGLQVREMRGLEAVFQADLRVMNPNEATLDIRGVDCALELNGRPFASGVSSSDAQIPAFETGIVSVTIYSSVIDMVRGMLDLPKKESLSYRITGKVRLGGGAIPSLVPFTAEGMLSARDLKAGP
jgi:LEA14-like dessication related protein